MEERSSPVEVPASNGEKCSETDSEDKNTHRHDSSDVSMPICFLVKEQAKSLVAIQDLQKRVENLETIQDDVIDSLAEIRKFLCDDSKTYSGLTTESSLSVSNHAASPISIAKSGSFSKATKFPFSPLSLKENKCASSKECGATKSPASAQISNHSEKQLESKSKELALESDKQDSGLDSDCREIHDNFSLNKPSLNWGKSESGDELLLLLDEISQRTEVLQKQLAVIDRNSGSDDNQSDYAVAPSKKFEKIKPSSHLENSAKTIANCLNCSQKLPKSVAGAYMEEAVAKRNSDDSSSEHFEGKSLSDRIQKLQKRAANKIDSAMVSSILKETSVVDLQRQVLIYLVENAVLHTKLSELEQLLSSKTLETCRIENSLKDETRLLMMENRELRITLDEQKLETNTLRSKVLMLERVLQSISVENRELTWQLGESLGIQNLSRKEPRKFSSSFTFGNSSNPKITRRSSLPPQFSCQNETNVHCVKSKLLSNASSFLDVTVEEPDGPHWQEVQIPGIAFENHGVPMQSTPMPNYTKLKDVKTTVCNPSPCSNFQSVKKRFKPIDKDGSLFKNRNLEKHLDEVPSEAQSETSAKTVKFNASNFDDTTKFPFNTILEKLKSNADYRVSRRTSLTPASEINYQSDHVKSTPVSKARLATCEGEENVASGVTPRPNSQSKNFQARRGKNIHQRIQDILDRIMSESEEAV